MKMTTKQLLIGVLIKFKPGAQDLGANVFIRLDSGRNRCETSCPLGRSYHIRHRRNSCDKGQGLI